MNQTSCRPSIPAVQGDEGRSRLDLVVVGGGVGAAVEGGGVDEHLHGLEKGINTLVLGSVDIIRNLGWIVRYVK